jgi:hypothetical protein
MTIPGTGKTEPHGVTLLCCFWFERAQIPQARWQRALRLQHIRNEARSPDHISARDRIVCADAVLANPTAHSLIGPAGEPRGLLRCKQHIAIKPIGLGVERVGKTAQFSGEGGAVLDHRQLGNQIGGGSHVGGNHLLIDQNLICRVMPSPATLEIVITPAIDRRGERLAGRFDARLGRGEWLARADVTPFYRAAQVLLSRGIAKPDDVLTMRHAGSPHELLRATVGKAAKMARDAPQRRASASNAAGGYPGSGRASTHR